MTQNQTNSTRELELLTVREEYSAYLLSDDKSIVHLKVSLIAIRDTGQLNDQRQPVFNMTWKLDSTIDTPDTGTPSPSPDVKDSDIEGDIGFKAIKEIVQIYEVRDSGQTKYIALAKPKLAAVKRTTKYDRLGKRIYIIDGSLSQTIVPIPSD